MNKKIVPIILILAGILCVCSVCHAELINALYGDCDQNTYQFFFQAEGNSSITFVQYPGKEKGIFEHDGGTGAMFSYNENGLYHITYGLVGKSTKTVDWENVFSFNDYDTYVLNLKDPGVYRITIDPYNDEEINNTYAIDHFGGWDKYPRWHVDHCDGGRLSLENDFTYSHSTTADYDSSSVEWGVPVETIEEIVDNNVQSGNVTFAESGSYYTNMFEIADWVNGKKNTLTQNPYAPVIQYSLGQYGNILGYFSECRNTFVCDAYIDGNKGQTKADIKRAREDLWNFVYNGNCLWGYDNLIYDNLSIAEKRELIDLGLALFAMDIPQTYNFYGSNLDNDGAFGQLNITYDELYQ